MSWIRWKLFKYFNRPLHDDAPYITDNTGRRFYYYLQHDPVSAISYYYKGRRGAQIYLRWQSEQQLELVDIVIHDPNLRGNGLGTAMFQQLLGIAQGQGVREIAGHIVNNEERTDISRQQNFYQQQGCIVEGEWFHINLDTG